MSTHRGSLPLSEALRAESAPDASAQPVHRNGSRRVAAGGAPTISHRFEYVGVRLLAGVFRAMPLTAASWTMGKAFRLFAPLFGRHRRALAHLALALPELAEPDRRRIAREMWDNLGRVAGEAMQIDRLMASPERVRLPDDFDRHARAVANGAVIASAHLGNWEIGTMAAAKAGISFAGVYHPLKNPLVEAYLRKLRSPGYPAGLHAKGAQTGARLISLARRGAAIGLVADVRELRGIVVTFFGQPAFATPMPAMVARLTGVPLIAAAMVRTRGVNFALKLREIEVPHTADRDADLLAATQALHEAFEEWIRETPAQWMWSHRKWANSGGPRRRRAAASFATSTGAAGGDRLGSDPSAQPHKGRPRALAP